MISTGASGADAQRWRGSIGQFTVAVMSVVPSAGVGNTNAVAAPLVRNDTPVAGVSPDSWFAVLKVHEGQSCSTAVDV